MIVAVAQAAAATAAAAQAATVAHAAAAANAADGSHSNSQPSQPALVATPSMALLSNTNWAEHQRMPAFTRPGLTPTVVEVTPYNLLCTCYTAL